jgi:multiple sugar transport system substrate-binding protein
MILKRGITLIVFFCTAALLTSCNDRDNSASSIRVAINAGAEGAAIRKAYEGFKDKQIKIVEYPYSLLREQLISVLAADEDKFDVVMIDDPWFSQLAPKLRPLENIPITLLDDILENSLALGKDPYGVGVLKALPYVGNTQLLFVRSDILAAGNYGNAPETWQELVLLAGRLQSISNNRYGYAIRGRSGAPVVTDFLPVYWSLGGKLTERDGNNRLISKLDSALFRRALETYRMLEQASPPGAVNFDWAEMTAAFTTGRAVMELNWPGSIPQIKEALPSTGAILRWSVSLPPREAGRSAPGTSMIGNWLLGIPRASKQADAAQASIIWLMDQQKRVADEGAPPTRKTVFAELAKSKPYFLQIQKALEQSTPRDRTEKWSQIEEAISRAVTSYLVRPTDVDPIMKRLESDMTRITE